MEDIKFNLESIEKTFVNYAKKKILIGKIVLLKNDGAVIDIGGKLDGFLPSKEFSEFNDAKIGDSFSVMLLGDKNDEGMILVSKNEADKIIIGNSKVETLKSGDKMNFTVTRIQNNNLIGYLGEYKIIIMNKNISLRPTVFLGKYLNNNIEVYVLEVDKVKKTILASVINPNSEKQENVQNMFWQNAFINKIVKGKVMKIMPYGAFVNVDDVDCFVHISDLSYNKIDKVEDFLTEGEEKFFRIIKLDKDNKKVLLGLKQMSENVKIDKLKSLEIGKVYNGKVTKILPFGALVALKDNIEGLLHISDTNLPQKRIYEIVQVEQEIDVIIKSVDLEKERVSLSATFEVWRLNN